MITGYKEYNPQIDGTAYVADTADIIGRVQLSRDASVWPNAVLRGDVDRIAIGISANIQDGVLVHTNYDMPVIVGCEVTVGHGAILHGCCIHDRCLIGMGAILLDGCLIGELSIVAAGALVCEGQELLPGGVYMGVPAKRTRDITREEKKMIIMRAAEYVQLAEEYRN